MLDEFWKYTLFTLFMIVSFEAGTAFSRRKNLATLKGMGNKPYSVKVFRQNKWIDVLTDDLLPGDLVSLRQQHQPGLDQGSTAGEGGKEQDKGKGSRATLGALKSVWRRGAGAFSSTHRPGMSRQQWAMGRVNAYLHLLSTGKPKNAKYTTDNDLLPKEHKRSTKKK